MCTEDLPTKLHLVGILQNATGEDSTAGTSDTATNAPTSGASSRLSGGDLRLSSVVAGRVDVAAGGVSSTVTSASSSVVFPAPAEVPHSPTPPLQRRLAKSFSVAPSSGLPKG